MEIPMQEVINSYRQQLSDKIHALTLRDLHIAKLEKKIEEKNNVLNDLQMKLDFYEITASGENLANEPDDWTEDNGDSDSARD